ncbi:MAG: hypothetical protein GY946_19755 [bacterium]|nr:hypothetical protein [bacterium]
MAGRKIRDEAEAREALRAVAASGSSLADWCGAEGIDARSLSGWRGFLSGRAGFEELRFVELVPAAPTASARSAGYRVQCGAFTVEVGDFEDDHLVRLLRVVAAAC